MRNVANVSIRRSRWLSFWIGAASLALVALLAAGIIGLLLLSVRAINGALLIILFLFLSSVLFFLSFPWQRRFVRSLERRRPGLRLENNTLTVPLAAETTIRFQLNEPHSLTFGWSETLVATIAAPTMHTRGRLTYAVLTQDGQRLFLRAEDSVSEAQTAGWPKCDNVTPVAPEVCLWASDLVLLVERLQKKEVGDQRSEVRGQKSEVSQEPL